MQGLLTLARRYGFTVWADGDGLRYRHDGETLINRSVLSQLKAHREELLAHFAAQEPEPEPRAATADADEAPWQAIALDYTLDETPEHGGLFLEDMVFLLDVERRHPEQWWRFCDLADRTCCDLADRDADARTEREALALLARWTDGDTRRMCRILTACEKAQSEAWRDPEHARRAIWRAVDGITPPTYAASVPAAASAGAVSVPTQRTLTPDLPSFCAGYDCRHFRVYRFSGRPIELYCHWWIFPDNNVRLMDWVNDDVRNLARGKMQCPETYYRKHGRK